MGYANLASCVADLERHGRLKRVTAPIDPHLEMALIQRRAFAKGSPALLFTRPKGCSFPMLANLFGTAERVNFIFRDTLERVKTIMDLRADAQAALRRHWRRLHKLVPALWHARPRHVRKAPVLARSCGLSQLPALVSWPGDGGPFITLPLVYTEPPDGRGAPNLGMYRIQLSGNEYAPAEVGMHYQTKRGVGIHHAAALARGENLPVNVFVGGPPALTVAAIMPLPEGMGELLFAGLLGGRAMELARGEKLPVLAQCDFAIQGELTAATRPEGPFGDHLGYYSLRHEFPVMKVHRITHRPDAVWPFTSVGRPPQEDTMFGDLIHELTAPMVSNVFPGIREIHAVDAAGVHPLLLAIGNERYTAYEGARKPRELLTLAMHLLGTTQTSLAKFVLIAAAEDAPGLNCHDVGRFLGHMLERTDFGRDLHFLTQSGCDTLDYSGYALHEGSRLIWTACGDPRRSLASEVRDLPPLPDGFGPVRLVMPGVLAISAPPHRRSDDESCRLRQDGAVEQLALTLKHWPQRERFPLVVVVDDAEFCSASLNNFLWVVFTRADPARDSYGVNAATTSKHWICQSPLILDGRLKCFQAPPLEDDPAVVARVEELARAGQPLVGLV